MKRINPEDCGILAQVVHQYYVNGESQNAIARRWKVKQSTISSWLQLARDWGVLSFSIDAEGAVSGSEYREKSNRLRDGFDLKEAFVVDVGDERPYKKESADDLQAVVANTVASERLRYWILPADHVAIGSGRAPVKVARTIKRTSPSSRDVRISPLSGSIWSGFWEEGSRNLQMPYDSNDAARLLASAFELQRMRYSQIGSPLYLENSTAVREAVKWECAFSTGGKWDSRWGVQPPTKALVGVGVLRRGSGHRIAELVEKVESSSVNNVPHRLRAAAEEFKIAMNLTTDHGLPPFGDVANRLFPALFLPSELKAVQTRIEEINIYYDDLIRALNQLNSRAVVMEWEHLRGIPSVWVVAAGDLKINVLFTLAIERYLEGSRGRSIIKELATDLKTAGQLLKALDDYRRCPPELKDWYGKMVRKIFVDPQPNQ